MLRLRVIALFTALVFTVPAFAQTNVIDNFRNASGTPTPVSPTNPLPITGSFSAGTFAPGGAYATLTATGSSADTALPAGAAVIAFNTGTTAVSCSLSVGAGVAVANQNIVQPSSWLGFSVGSNTHIACIDQTGSTSNLVVVSGGSGSPTGAGGGGPGGAGLSVTDQTAWVQGTSAFTPTGCVFNDTATLSSGFEGTVRCNTKRAFIVDVDTIGNALYTAITAGVGTTGSPVPASTLYNGFNVSGTLRGWTGVNPTGSVFAGQVDIASVNGTSVTSAGVPTISGGNIYNTIAASQTAQALTGGGGGATGDYLSHCVVYPTSTSPGVVTVFDNTSSAANNAIAFAGGASSSSNLVPFAIPVGAKSVNGAWKVTTGANLVVTCYGKFTALELLRKAA